MVRAASRAVGDALGRFGTYASNESFSRVYYKKIVFLGVQEIGGFADSPEPRQPVIQSESRRT